MQSKEKKKTPGRVHMELFPELSFLIWCICLVQKWEKVEKGIHFLKINIYK